MEPAGVKGAWRWFTPAGNGRRSRLKQQSGSEDQQKPCEGDALHKEVHTIDLPHHTLLVAPGTSRHVCV